MPSFQPRDWYTKGDTMARILTHWRILSATLFSLALIAGATFVARDAQSPRSAQASAESDLLKAIASKDTDGDGLPDWEESLYGADANKIDTFNLGMPDGQAVAKGLVVPKAVANYEVNTVPNTSGAVDPSLPPPPTEGTLTSAFAQTLYAVYRTTREAKGSDLSDVEIQIVTQEALKTFSASIKPSSDFKTAQDLSVSGSGADALRTYAVAVDAIFAKNANATIKSEIFYLQDVVNENKEESLSSIVSIAKSYRESAIGIAQLTVPKELADQHLRLINALMRLGELTTNFAQVRVDPLATMLALEQYPKEIVALARTFIDVSATYTAEEIVFAPGEPGSAFVNMIANIAAKQASAKKP